MFEAGVLIDSCVLMDTYFPFRAGHAEAFELVSQLGTSGTLCYMPSHAYFEQAVACIVHFKREPEKFDAHPLNPNAMPHLNLQVVTLSNEYVNHLLQVLAGQPIPDLKSQDIIYFCIARDRGLTLLTQDRKLRNTVRKGGIDAFDVGEALTMLRPAP